MTITLQRFDNGDTNYIAKHNANAEAIEGAVGGLESAVSASLGSVVSVGTAFQALFGEVPSVINADSYKCTGASTTLTVQPGYSWKPSTGMLTQLIAPATISFAALAAGTYYIYADTTGAPQRETVSTDALYSVVWTGSAFGAITRVCGLAWGADEWTAAQDSAALGDTFDSLDDRLEAGEVKAVLGDLSRTYDIGQLTKSVAGSADVALTDIEANNAILRFTGVLTGDIDVSITMPAPRIWLVKNDTTGAFTITLKGASGTGEVVPQGSVSWSYHDGTNVKVIDIATVGGLGTAAFLSVDTDDTLAADSDSLIATQQAVKAYVDNEIAGAVGGITDAMVLKGVIDCSANPNYPAADAGWSYKISVAGKIGGASGPNVEIGDTVYCIADSTASGNHATVGAYWVIQQANIDLDIDGTLAANSDGKVATQKAVKTYADAVTAAATHAATNKATPVDADELPLADSAASFGLKHLTWANLKATVKTYFDTLYAPKTQPLVVVPFFPGSPTASQLVGLFPVPAGVGTLTFAAALAGSSGKALTAATAQTDFDVRQNATTSASGTSVGTIRWAAAGTVPTFIAASGFTIADPDYLTVWAPATPDATLANFSAALYATR